jgi:TRAP transporter 4TM/12TM fusion protein
VIFGTGVLLTVGTLAYAQWLPVSRLRFSNLFLGVGLFLFYLVQVDGILTDPDAEPPESEDRPTDADGTVSEAPVETGLTTLDIRGRLERAVGEAVVRRANAAFCLLLAVAALAATGYVALHFDRLQGSAPIVGWTNTDYYVGLVILYLSTDATYRAYGKAIAAVVAGSLLYASAAVGPYLPGIFQHSGFGLAKISREGAIGLSGVYGFILTVGSTWVAVFIMFAGMAKVFGLMDFIIDVSRETRKTLDSGVVHIAVIGSMIMGSITGSAAANTATTGSFTIPMMKDQGVGSDFAAAIESVASSGGQMLPPVMGVAAFLMADFLGISYVRVIQAGLLPALIFYFSVFVAVHLLVRKHGWMVDAEGTFDRSVVLGGLHFLVPLFVLVYMLAVERLTPLGAGKWTIVALVATMFVRNLAVDGPSLWTILETAWQTVRGLKQGAVEMAPLVGVLASLGIVLSMLTQTGLTQKISAQMIGLAGGVFVFLLVLAMLTSILFGLGMPTPAAYVLVVILVAPAMVSFGVREITAHMFVFYFAMLSAITPPVAISVAIGSKIADAPFLRSAKQALRIGAPGFVIPFAFVANEGLLYWSLPETPIAVLVVFVGVLSLTIATTGYDGTRSIGLPSRGLFLGLAAAAMWGPRMIQVAAVAAIVVGVAVSTNVSNPFAGDVEEAR